MDHTLTIAVHIERLPHPPRLDSENLILSAPVQRSSGKWIENLATKRKEWHGDPQYIFTARAKQPGRAIVGPLRDANGAILIDERRVITIDETPGIDCDKPARTIALLRQRALEPVCLRVQATPARALVGQQVIVLWTLYSGENFITAKLGEVELPSSARTEELPAESYEMPIAEGRRSKLRSCIAWRSYLDRPNRSASRPSRWQFAFRHGHMSTQNVRPPR